jgi:hypothetical protein
MPGSTMVFLPPVRVLKVEFYDRCLRPPQPPLNSP